MCRCVNLGYKPFCVVSNQSFTDVLHPFLRICTILSLTLRPVLKAFNKLQPNMDFRRFNLDIYKWCFPYLKHIVEGSSNVLYPSYKIVLNVNFIFLSSLSYLFMSILSSA